MTLRHIFGAIVNIRTHFGKRQVFINVKSAVFEMMKVVAQGIKFNYGNSSSMRIM